MMAKLDALFHTLWRRLYDSDACEKEVALSDQVTTQYGLTASASQDPGGLKFLRVTDINKQNWLEWSSVPSVPADEVAKSKYLLSRGDLLVARMADPGKSALYDDDSVPAVFASYLVRLTPRSFHEAIFLYGFLKSREYAEYSAVASTGSVQKNMNARVIVGINVRWPTRNALLEFSSQGMDIRNKISKLVAQNDLLKKSRDALLPELLSGNIRVPDSEGAE